MASTQTVAAFDLPPPYTPNFQTSLRLSDGVPDTATLREPFKRDNVNCAEVSRIHASSFMWAVRSHRGSPTNVSMRKWAPARHSTAITHNTGDASEQSRQRVPSRRVPLRNSLTRRLRLANPRPRVSVSTSRSQLRLRLGAARRAPACTGRCRLTLDTWPRADSAPLSRRRV
jgi:hypothetical protein